MFKINVFKLDLNELKQLGQLDWVCSECIVDDDSYDTTDTEYELENFNISDEDFKKYDNMVFNPLRFENTFENENDLFDFHDFTVLNVNIRSLSKNWTS